MASSGDDPDLDSLLISVHTETAARRGGALALRPIDLAVEQGVIKLREKGGTVRWQPVSPVSRTLMTHLVRHSLERKVPGREQLLRYRHGKPITYRRYDHLWMRVRGLLPWAEAHGSYAAIAEQVADIPDGTAVALGVAADAARLTRVLEKPSSRTPGAVRGGDPLAERT